MDPKYYEAWCRSHVSSLVQLLTFGTDEEDVRKGNLSLATFCGAFHTAFQMTRLIMFSRYFSLAHEIAHNLVQQYNSQHDLLLVHL
jgi:hypothetical protein